MSDPQAVASVLRIPIGDLTHGLNARGELGNVDDLAQALRTLGQQQPLLVEPLDNGTWSVFDGNRRLKAARAAGLTHMLAIPRKALTGQQRILRQLGMHATGKNFDPMAEAHAIEWLLFADDGPHMDRADVARALSRSESWVKGRLDLLQLHPDEQASVEKGTLAVSTAISTVTQRRTGQALGAHRPAARTAQPTCTDGGCCGCRCHKRNRT